MTLNMAKARPFYFMTVDDSNEPWPMRAQLKTNSEAGISNTDNSENTTDLERNMTIYF